MPPRRKPWFWRLAALLVALLLGAAVWAGWYVYNRGFTRKWRDQLTAELRSRGLDFTARRLTLNPFEGLVAEDAHLYLLDERRTPLVFMSRAAVDINYLNLILRKPFLNSLDVRGARLSVPVDFAQPQGPKFRLHKFQAKLSFQPGEIRLNQAEGECYGILLSVSGTLLHPESLSRDAPPATREELARRLGIARAVIDELQKVRFDRRPPRVDIRFNGDLARPEEIRASAEVSGEGLTRGAARLERLRARVDYEAGAFHLRQAELADAAGTLTGDGDFNPVTGDLRFQLDSTADLLALARDFAPAPAILAGFQPAAPPHLHLDGKVRLPPGGGPAGSPSARLTGRIELGPFSFRAIPFSSGGAEFSWQDGSWYLRGLRVARPGGQEQLVADVMSQPGQVRVKLNGTMDPAAFAALLPARGQAALGEWKFTDPPGIELTATGASLAEPAGLRIEGRLTLGKTKFREVGMNGLRSEFTFAEQALTYRRFTLERDEGSATGDSFVYDFAKHEVRVQNVRATLDPAQVSVWMDPDVTKALAPYRFHKTPATVSNGVVQFDGGRNSRLTVDFNAPNGMDYLFAKKLLTFKPIAGQVIFTDDRLKLNGIKAGVFDGQAVGHLDLSLARGEPDYTASLEVQDLDFTRLTKLYFNYDDSAGRLAGSYRFSGRGDDPRTMRGAGMMKVDQGNVFAIPFLGPLSSVVSAVAPGLGFDIAREGSLDFLTNGGKIYTGNLRVQGVGFSLFGGGWLGYVDDAMNFRVRINARGLPGAVLYPVSKLLEYESHGPSSKPVWKPRGIKLEPKADEPKPPS